MITVAPLRVHICLLCQAVDLLINILVLTLFVPGALVFWFAVRVLFADRLNLCLILDLDIWNVIVYPCLDLFNIAYTEYVCFLTL